MSDVITTFVFNLGDTSDNPLGMTARVRAHDNAEAAALLNAHLEPADELRPGKFYPRNGLGVNEIRIWSNRLTVSADDALEDDG